MPRPIRIHAGSLGALRLLPGRYLYLGSARRNLRQRVERHARLAGEKSGNLHWHIDALLTHRFTRLVAAELIPGGDECALVGEALAAGALAPVPRFGATDCRNGCPAHLLFFPAGAGSGPVAGAGCAAPNQRA